MSLVRVLLFWDMVYFVLMQDWDGREQVFRNEWE